MANDVVKKEFTTAISEWSNTIVGLVRKDYQENAVNMDEYSNKCALAAMTSIYQLVQSNKDVNMGNLDTSNLREVVGQCASLKLNANAFPRECYFQLRKTKQSDGSYKNVVELGIEGSGNDSILRNFGVDVAQVYPFWAVKEGDDFTYPKRRGIETEPPVWEEKGLSQKCVRVVYPVKLNDGTITYLISERDSVKTNLLAHVRQNMLNATFGLLGKGKNGKERTKYDATEEELELIKAKKNEVLDALRKCETVDEMLECELARPFMSGAWLDTPESMIVRKMCNNATKKFPKDYDSMANRSYLQLDETYQASQQEIAENANKDDFSEVDDADVVDSTAVDVNEIPFQ